MEHDKNHNHNGSGGNGFLLGVIVGVLITLLFTTKRGRTILKDVMEKGVQKFADLEQLMRETEEELGDELEDEDGDDYVPTEPVKEPKPPKPVEKKAEPVRETVEEVKTQPAPKASLQPKSEKAARDASPDSNAEHSSAGWQSDADGEKPKFLDEDMVDQVTVEETEASVEPETKPKAARVKRLFRGLRKKS